MPARPDADAGHTPWSDPGAQRAFLRTLPADPALLPDALERFVVHHVIAPMIGHPVPAHAEGDRGLRFAERLLAAQHARDPRPLTEKRPIQNYLYGTCHDFALLAIAALREAGIPARLRVGFAGYFDAGRWQDHWVCEYWTGDRWALMDGQLGPIAREGIGIRFDVADMPAGAWISAAQAWRAIRAGALDAALCGYPHADLVGEWFVAAALMRDAAALAGIETLPWDHWGIGAALRETRRVTEGQRARLDALAAAVDPAPADRDSARRVLAAHPWVLPDDADLAEH